LRFSCRTAFASDSPCLAPQQSEAARKNGLSAPNNRWSKG
jgi:hypothetical protein